MISATNACGRTDVGHSRRHNEDSFQIDLENGAFVVADGMGGHGNGEVASRFAANVIVESLARILEGTAADKRDTELRDRCLRGAFADAQQRIRRATEENTSLSGMGTTAVCCLFGDERVSVAHVGDSRVYRLRDQALTLLTEDHTWVGEQVRAGVLSEDEARFHPLKSVVTRALGAENGNEPDVLDLEVREGDLYVLCSDGLTNMVDEGQMAEILMAGSNLEETCRELVKVANAQGGLDNITVVIAAV